MEQDSPLAWVICFSAFIDVFIIIGIDNSFGVVIGSLMELLGSSTSNIAWVHSVHSSSMFLFASVSSALTNKFGFRIVILIGTILSCVSYIACVFMQNFIALLLVYGLLGGAGSGLLFTPGNIACVHYFNKHKALATGISASGGGLGTICISMLCNYVNINYGCTGYFLTIGFLSSLTLIFAIFASPVKSEDETLSEDNCKTEIEKPPMKQNPALAQPNKRRRSSIALDAHINAMENVNKRRKSSIYLGAHMNAMQNFAFAAEGEGDDLTEFDQKVRRTSIALDAHIITLQNASRRNSTYSPTETDDVGGMQLKSEEGSNGALEALKLLKDARMFFYSLVHVMFELAYYIPIVFLPEMMIHDHGISKDWAGMVISVLGISHMVGKILAGILVQYSTISPTIFSATCLGLLGGSCIGFTFCSQYEEFMILTVVYGLVLSSIDLFNPLILVDMFGGNKLKDSFGIIMLAKMFSPMWGPPIGGAFRDWTGKYLVAFYAAGTFQLVGGFFNVLVCIFHLRRKS